MRVLIIGGTGLISTPMPQLLRERGDSVVLYNRAKRRTELPAGVGQIVGDRTDFDHFEAQLQGERFDCVIDMVCFTPEDARSVVRTFAGRTQQLIFCSTVDVYHKPPRAYPISEAAPYGPAPWRYAQDKARCEEILWSAHERGDFALTVFRPAQTYSDSGALLSSFGGRTSYLDRLKQGKPIVVHGDGQSLWGAAHANDVAPAFVAACGNPQSFGRSYNVTSDELLTWSDMHRIVAEVLGGPRPSFVFNSQRHPNACCPGPRWNLRRQFYVQQRLRQHCC